MPKETKCNVIDFLSLLDLRSWMVSPNWHFFNLFISVPLILCPWNLCIGIVIDGLIWEHDDHWFGNSHLNRSSLERCHRLQYLLDMRNPSRPQEWPEVIRDNHEATSNKSNNYLNWYKSDRKEKIPKNKKKKIIRKSNRLPLKMLKGFTVSLCYPSWVKKMVLVLIDAYTKKYGTRGSNILKVCVPLT